MSPLLTYSSPHQSLHSKSHSFNKLLRPLDGSLENPRQQLNMKETRRQCLHCSGFMLYMLT